MSDKNTVLKRIRNSALIKNPLLFEAIGLCPVVAIAHSLKLAIFLAIVTAIEMIICEVLASLLLKNVRRYWRVALYTLFGVIIIFPIMYITGRLSSGISANFGVYLPLMVVNSLIALHCERVAVKNDVKNSFIDAVSASLSYGVVTVLVGFLRELFGNGSIWGISLNIPVKIPAFLMPFGGLIVLGFLAAGLKAFISVKYPEANPNKAFDTSEIRRSLRGTFKDLMNDEFNPYGDTAEEDAPSKRLFNGKKSKSKNLPEKEELTEETPAQRIIKDRKEKAEMLLKTEQDTHDTSVSQSKSENYLDDFSEMLSELENRSNSNSSGGDEQ